MFTGCYNAKASCYASVTFPFARHGHVNGSGLSNSMVLPPTSPRAFSYRLGWEDSSSSPASGTALAADDGYPCVYTTKPRVIQVPAIVIWHT